MSNKNKRKQPTKRVKIPKYVSRMIKEIKKLDTKVIKLGEFLDTQENIESKKRSLMQYQLNVMKKYVNILRKRLNIEFKEIGDTVYPKGTSFKINEKGYVKFMTNDELIDEIKTVRDFGDKPEPTVNDSIKDFIEELSKNSKMSKAFKEWADSQHE